MPTFALAMLDEFEDDEDASLRVRCLSRNGRNTWENDLKGLRKDGKKREIDTLLRYLEDLRYGKPLPPRAFTHLGTRKSTGSPVHEHEYEFVIGQLRGYCVLEKDFLIVLFSAHAKKGKGGRRQTDQSDHINAMRAILRALDVPLYELPEAENTRNTEESSEQPKS